MNISFGKQTSSLNNTGMVKTQGEVHFKKVFQSQVLRNKSSQKGSSRPRPIKFVPSCVNMLNDQVSFRSSNLQQEIPQKTGS